MEGWGPKKLDMSFEAQNPGKTNFLAGYPGIFAGISRGCPKSLRKKRFNSRPLKVERGQTVKN